MSDDELEDGAGPAALVAGSIVGETDASMALVVLVIGTDGGMVGIDVAQADVALPSACAEYTPVLLAMLDAIRGDVRRRINEFDRKVALRRVDRGDKS